MNLLTTILSRLLDIVLPKERAVADLETLARNGTMRRLVQAPDLPHLNMKALFHYKDPKVKTLIWQIKYAGNKTLTRAVGQLISEEIVSFFEEQGSFTSKNWYVVPIPASKKHLKEKGFNQTQRIVSAIMEHDAKNFVVYSPDILIKRKETDPQVAIRNRAKRLQNLKNMYGTKNNHLLVGANVFVVDDVITTGSTMQEAQRALIIAGAKQVICLSIAH